METTKDVVLVTGAGRGIGRGIAQAFAAEGCAVIVNDVDAETARTTARDIEQAGGRARALPADLRDVAAVRALFDQARQTYGDVTVLINNAAFIPFVPVERYTVDMWNQTVETNLSAIFHCVRAVTEHMVSAGHGSVINIASVHAQRTLPNTSAYAATKAAVVGLTRSLALELGPKNIRVNCISPGAIDTEGLQAYFASLSPEDRDNERRRMLGWQPLGRFGNPDDIAQLAIFLCSRKAEFIHGADIVIDGGLLARLL
jgi:NAD(P)-dependent dehydrogenase (short-subunit alcohol dehydrogenase family)